MGEPAVEQESDPDARTNGHGVDEPDKDVRSLVADLKAEVSTLRDELQEEREARRAAEARLEEVESLIGTGPSDTDVRLEDLWLAGVPAGQMIEGANNRSKDTARVLFGVGTDYDKKPGEIVDEHGPLVDAVDGTSAAQPARNREAMLPVHRMFRDVKAGDATALRIKQERAAHVFAQFAYHMTGEDTRVDGSGQKLTVNTEDVEYILRDADVLDVAESSVSQTVGRTMREVQRLTITEIGEDEDHECPTVDQCDHGLFEFRAGNPHSLAVSKDMFRSYLSELSDNDVRSSDDGERVENSPEDLDVDSEVARLEAAKAGDSDV